MKKYEIYYCDLSPVVGSEQGGYRPCVIIQNDVGNRYSPTIIVAACTTSKTKSRVPTHFFTKVNNIDNVVLCEQLRTIDKSRVKNYVGEIPENEREIFDKKLMVSLGL